MTKPTVLEIKKIVTLNPINIFRKRTAVLNATPSP